jgi:hypothetical protein
MGMVYAAKKGKKPASSEVAKAAADMSEKEAKKFAKTKHKGLPVHKEETDCGSSEQERDTRGDYAKVAMVKNKLRAMGMKNPIVMAASYEPEGEIVDEATAAAERGVPETHRGDVEGRRAKARESLSAARKGELRRLRGAQKLEKSGNTEHAKGLLTGKSREEKEHRQNFPGSKQKPKVKGAPESASEKHRRTVNRTNERIKKHGLTSKEERHEKGMEQWRSARD